MAPFEDISSAAYRVTLLPSCGSVLGNEAKTDKRPPNHRPSEEITVVCVSLTPVSW